MSTLRLNDKEFELSVPAAAIQEAIDGVAAAISADLAGKRPVFVCVLDGAFMFASDLLKRLSIDCEITFVKVASYSGMASTGVVKELIGLEAEVKGRTVVIVEDIVDTGLTIETVVRQVRTLQPAEVKVAALLFKPQAYTKDIPLDYVALEVPDKFLVGYGLDYDGLGRNLEDLYVLAEQEITVTR